jgi:hypothetical protein
LKRLNRITNLDKTIKDLQNRLDEAHPYSSTSSSINNHQNRNDGINFWKGKKIISTQVWNDLYEKKSTYTNAYTTTLGSRKPLQYFPDDYNGLISAQGIVDEKLKEEAQNWNKDYYELLEYRKNPIVGRIKCRNCLLSGSLDDPIFIGIEKVFGRIVSNQCNNNNNTHSHQPITYHCNIMNIFSCPFKGKEESNNNNCKDKKIEESNYSYKREDLYSLHEISFAIEQAITTFFEITKQNEIIYEVDFENDRVQEIHTKYNGEPESWGWQENVKEQLSKVKAISNIVIRDDQDIYNILTNKEKLEYLVQEYVKENNHQLEKEGIDNYNIKVDPNTKIKEEFEKSKREQKILLKENKQNIIDFILDNKESIKIEDLKIYEPIYKCYREKGHCIYCNTTTNIICKNCSNYNYNNNKEIWLCVMKANQY